ncbi:hypothetical protein BZG01_16680 [Labilibaculum manganireducens]|uniref:Uncharacterized protein n=1 Tax=Labilibaculum manganireducens TaxID=1940525 RepID=A0A2N3HY08_9BACT|nr:hypothetical protein BZG01_16680 [Labilibaculum manganireducens]
MYHPPIGKFSSPISIDDPPLSKFDVNNWTENDQLIPNSWINHRVRDQNDNKIDLIGTLFFSENF